MNEQSLTRGLAFFSIGLGLAELLAPRKVAELIGVNDDKHDNLIRMMGARELAAGLGIMQGKPAHFLWARVAGDALDLGLLAAAAKDERNDPRKLQLAIGAVAAVTVLDVIASTMQTRDHAEPGWRIRGPRSYSSGMDSAEPMALRASADEVMQQHQSGHLLRDDEDISLPHANEDAELRSPVLP